MKEPLGPPADAAAAECFFTLVISLPNALQASANGTRRNTMTRVRRFDRLQSAALQATLAMALSAYHRHLPKIAFITSQDPQDRRSWSGIYYYMLEALRKHCGEVVPLGPALFQPETIGEPFNRVTRRLVGRVYDYDHSWLMSGLYGAVFGRRLQRETFDLIFAPTASTEIARLKTDVPIVYFSDTTFALMRNYYPSFASIFEFSAREANRIERSAIRKADILVYPSLWAAESAVADYGAEQDRVHVIPMGANIDEAPPVETIGTIKPPGCRLLFLARDWHRKGGPIAFETLVQLRQMGIDAELVVCGCIPPQGFSHAKLTVIPYLDKNNPQEREQLEQLLARSHFLLIPTRADCFGIVFCEANAFGLPVVTTDTGGVAGAVRDGVNGFMLPIEAGGGDYAQLIHRLLADETEYVRLVRQSRAEFDQTLNWDVWGTRVADLMRALLDSRYGIGRDRG